MPQQPLLEILQEVTIPTQHQVSEVEHLSRHDSHLPELPLSSSTMEAAQSAAAIASLAAVRSFSHSYPSASSFLMLSKGIPTPTGQSSLLSPCYISGFFLPAISTVALIHPYLTGASPCPTLTQTSESFSGH